MGNRTFLAAAIQMDSGPDPVRNREKAARLIEQAAAAGARLAALPETMAYAGLDIPNHAEAVPEGPTCTMLRELAVSHSLWLHGGTIYEAQEGGPPFNTTAVFSPTGELAAVYRKIHPFDVTLPDGTVSRESAGIRPGREPVLCRTGDCGTLGLAICYDLRFPELFRLLALAGAEILLVPASFTRPTGLAHWETLLRARAIENGCYVIAPAQCGRKPRYTANGTSLIVDPWGNVLARAEEEECVITAEIDLDYLHQVRAQLGCLHNRREDVYTLQRADPS